jgi:peptide/nickel transport system permease protein
VASVAPPASGSLRGDWRIRHASALQETRHNVHVFFRDKLATAGVCVILAVVVVAVFAPLIAPYPDQGRGASDISERLQAPSWSHLCGTDNQGRDVLSRIVFGARIALVMPAIVGIGVVLIGVPLGGIAGYYGGWLDEVIMRITDIFLAFPGLILAMALVAFLGPSLRNVAIALVVTWWPWYARLVRSMAISLRQRPYVKAARTIGVGNPRIILRHVLPNSMGPVIVQMSLDVGAVILEVAALSFIGLGARPPSPDWGLMISDGRQFILEQWWMAVFPGLAILVLVLAFNFVGDGLRDVLDPRSRR